MFLVVTDRGRLQPVRTGVEIAAALLRLFPGRLTIDTTAGLLGRDTIERLKRGEDPAQIAAHWAPAEAAWRLLRAKYLLYR